MSNTELLCQSKYVTMCDGVRVAVSTWLPNDHRRSSDRYPAILTTTRYWRATALHQDNPELQKFYTFACYLLTHGYVLVAADARGSGASFGCRESEYSPAEVEDIGKIIEWVARQTWCDGRVATEGTSYTANTALCGLVTAPSALKVAVCRAPDFDMYRHVFAPSGIANHWFIEAWGAVTCAQDNNDVEALLTAGYQPPEGHATNILGVRPVDEDLDGTLLAAAVAEHHNNFNIRGREDDFRFVDTKPFASHRFLFEPEYQERIVNSNIPAVVRCGWHDAGAALGALCMFNSLESPMRVILGPWNHSGYFRADPLLQADGSEPEIISQDTVFGLTVKSFDAIFKQPISINKDTDNQFGVVEYYTLGENRWKTTRQWPLPQTKIQRLYLAESHQLKTDIPISQGGSDLYQVDPTTGTGINNRWHAQMGNPIFFPDRRHEDNKLLIYDTPPLKKDIEITGHPVVHLYLRSTASDGQFFVYLETIDPDGRVRLLTEGQLRGLHRKVSDESPPYKMYGPYHSLKEKDALPLVPDEVAEIAFDLYPISVLLSKGQRIRLAIAGADADVFASIPGCEAPEITVERNMFYSSYIDLPTIQVPNNNVTKPK